MIKKLLIAFALTVPSLCQAQLTFTLTSQKSGNQIAPTTINYTGGALRIDIVDGSAQIAPCVFNGTTRADGAPFFPSTMPPCPLGTTGAILFGDFDIDGIPDAGTFWSLPAPPTPAGVVAPFLPNLVQVLSAPPSLFPRPGILPVATGGFVVWYDVLTGINQRQYEISGYSHQQNFAATEIERVRHDETVVTGTYKFGLPGLLSPIVPPGTPNPQVVLSLNKLTMPESYPGLAQSPIARGFRFTNDTAWNNGAIEFDPRVFNDITWSGIDATNTLTGIDTVRLWIRDTPAADPLALPAAPIDANVSFPLSGSPFILPFPRTGIYRLPTFFYSVGDVGTLYLRLDRNHFSTGVTSDTSVRVWTAQISFIDTYEGFALFSFPAGTVSAARAADFDFDGDGFSNFLEFALGSDPLDAVSIPLSVPANIGATAGVFEVNPLGDGRCQVSITKRPNVGASIKYYIEHSSDLVTWTRIPEGGDADWVENVNDAASLMVTSVNSIVPGIAPACYFRVAVVEN